MAVLLHKGAPDYPSSLLYHLREDAPAAVTAEGNLDALGRRPLALFCSVRCPGTLIIQTYDLAQRLRQAGATVIGGFHSPMERECLNILLKGRQPVIFCPARDVDGIRLPVESKKAMDESRLLSLSPFTGRQQRPTLAMALYRNRFVAALAHAIFVAYAAPGGKTEEFCREVLWWEKPLYTFADEANANLLAMGASPVRVEQFEAWLAEAGLVEPRKS